MAKAANPPKCKCGCGEPTERYYRHGIFKSYIRYKRDHRPGVIINGERQCVICKEWKPRSDFGASKRKNGKILPFSYCRPCFAKRGMDLRRKQYGSIRNYWLLRRYKITEQEVDAMKAKHAGLCPLCQRREATDVDHCHSTGKVRGILCASCNQAMGRLGDTQDSIARVLAYLTA